MASTPRRLIVVGLVRSAHLGPSIVVTVVGVALGVASGVDPGRLVLLGAALLAGQVSIGWANDWLDAVRGLDVERPDKPAVTGDVTVAAVRRAAVAALALCAVLSLSLGWLPGGVHLVAVAAGWAYDLVLKATAASAVPYLIAFGLLPSVATATAGMGMAPTWATVVGACFGAGVHVANALPDLDLDARSGVRGLPQRLGHRRSVVATVVLLGLGTAVAVVGPSSPATGIRLVLVVALTVGAAASLAALAWTGGRGRAETAYRLAMVSGLVVVALLLVRGDAL